jgi:hypothetical protein
MPPHTITLFNLMELHPMDPMCGHGSEMGHLEIKRTAINAKITIYNKLTLPKKVDRNAWNGG